MKQGRNKHPKMTVETTSENIEVINMCGKKELLLKCLMCMKNRLNAFQWVFQTEVISHCMLHVAEALSANNIVTVLHLMLPC